MNIDAKILNKKMANQIKQKLKDYSPQISQLQPRNAGVVQHMKINKCNTAH
jgi:hypothetical protein